MKRGKTYNTPCHRYFTRFHARNFLRDNSLYLENESLEDWASFDAAFGIFSDVVSARPDVPAIIAEGMEMFAAIPEQQLAALYLEDDQDHTFYPAASSPQQNHEEALQLLQHLISNDLLAGALREKKPKLLVLTEEFRNFEGIVSVPLVSPSGILGVLLLCYPDIARTPTPVRMETLRHTALFFALRFENTTLRHSVESLEGILEQRVAARTTELHKLKTEYESIIDCVHSGIVLINPTSHIIEYANPAASRLLESVATPLVGRNAEAFFEGLDEDIAAMNYLSLLYYDKEKRLRKESGSSIPVLQSAATIIFDKKTLLLLTFFDISERKAIETRLERINEELEDNVSRRTEELQEIIAKFAHEIEMRERTESALEEQERLFSVIFDVVSIGLCVTDTEGMFSRVNNAYCSMYGYSKEELIGQPIEKVIEPQNQHAIRQMYDNFMAGNEKDSAMELMIVSRNGAHLSVHLSSTVIYRNDGKKYLVSALVDITEHRQAQQNTMIALERERQLHEIKTNFVQMVSHEFRTPLTTVLSYTQLLKNYRQHWSEEQQDKYFNNIEMGVKQLTSLLEDVLLLGEAEHGHPVVMSELVNIRTLCTDVVKQAEIAFSDSAKRIQTEFQCNDLNIVIDPKVTRRILANLLSNALKYSQIDTPVIFTVECSETHLTFIIADNGIGIPEEYLPKVFEPFSRAPNTGMISGTGLGMAIVRNAIEMLRGTINIESVVNKGTTVTIVLPILISQEKTQ